MVWKYKSKEKLDDYLPGTYIMGDLDTLGWVIIKAFQFEGDDLKTYSNYMEKKVKNVKIWYPIQSSSEQQMQFSELIAKDPYPELFSKPTGTRRMLAQKRVGKLFVTGDILNQWFDKNLKISSQHIHFNTT